MGSWCKHEDWRNCPTQPPAIKGLHSEWVLDLLIGSQRPSQRLIEEYGIIEEFKRNNVVAIFNLQEPGEHAYCGDGILASSGFAYNPETFMNAGISYFNFYWEDLTKPSFVKCLKIVQVMHHLIVQGGEKRKNKVLVHCHAG